MPVFQPPPTWAEVILYSEDRKKGNFNPVWLKWFIDLVGYLNASGGASGVVHNSTSGIQGGTANQFYHLTNAEYAALGSSTAGQYTPTLTNVANVAASTAYQCQYLRVGGTVFVSGLVDVDPTAVGAVQLGISLPVASNFGAVEDCAGVAASSGVAGQSAAIAGDAANNRAEMQWVAVDVANRPMYFTFGYQVI